MDFPAEQLRQIRELAKHRLQRLNRDDHCPTESYVFENDRFCGIRFRHGSFHAQWILNDDSIEFFRENKLVDQVRLNMPVRRAA